MSSGRLLIAITSCSQRKGFEFRDESVSLSLDYARKVAACGGLPLVLPNLDLDATATTSDGIVEAVEAPGHPFLIAVQFHPERLLHEGENLFDPLWAEFLLASGGGSAS